MKKRSAKTKGTKFENEVKKACADAGVPNPRVCRPVEGGAGRDVIERAEVEIEELGLGGPIGGERPLDAAADGQTDAVLAIGAEIKRPERGNTCK